MPKDSDHRELTREELEQKQREKFNTFFTTSVAQVPEEMMNPTRAASQPDRKHGLLARFFGKRAKARGTPPPDQEEEEELFWAETPIAPGPTGEIMLDSADPQTEPVTGPSLEELTLELEGVRSKPEQARKEEPAPQPEQPPGRRLHRDDDLIGSAQDIHHPAPEGRRGINQYIVIFPGLFYGRNSFFQNEFPLPFGEQLILDGTHQSR